MFVQRASLPVAGATASASPPPLASQLLCAERVASIRRALYGCCLMSAAWRRTNAASSVICATRRWLNTYASTHAKSMYLACERACTRKHKQRCASRAAHLRHLHMGYTYLSWLMVGMSAVQPRKNFFQLPGQGFSASSGFNSRTLLLSARIACTNTKTM